MWRVILRFSLNGDTGSKVRNALEPKLTSVGITNESKTGTWESTTCLPDPATKTLYEVLQILSAPDEIVTGCRLDHFWLYIDQKP